MKHDFWHNKWDKNEIGFHLPDANPLLVKHFHVLNLKQGARIFLPLCGKTLDIAWLLASESQSRFSPIWYAKNRVSYSL